MSAPDDIVAILRDWASFDPDGTIAPDLLNAADEIERLRVALEDLQINYDADMGYRRDQPEAPR